MRDALLLRMAECSKCAYICSKLWVSRKMSFSEWFLKMFQEIETRLDLKLCNAMPDITMHRVVRCQKGVILTDLETSPLPSEFSADIRKSYDTPLVRPVTVYDVVALPTDSGVHVPRFRYSTV